MSGSEHSDLIRNSFARQVDLFAKPDSPFAGRADATSWLGALTPDLIVLEVACGAAHLAEVAAAQVRQVVAIDLTPELLALASERVHDAGIDNVLLQQGDAEALPFVDDSFDLAYCRASLHHMAHPTRAVAEMVRVCRPGGRVVISDLVAPSADRRETFDEIHRLLDPSHVRALLYDELLDLFPEHVNVTTNDPTTIRLPLDIVVTPITRRADLVAALNDEIEGGPQTGLEPANEDGTLVLSFTTGAVQASVGPATMG